MTTANSAVGATQTQTQAPQRVVEQFFAACGAFDFDKAIAFIDEDCEYRNVPFHTARGKERIHRDLSSMTKAMHQFDVEMVNIAVNGNVVLTERVDTLGGRLFKAAIPLMGVFVVENGKITEWRDYFDWSATIGRMGSSLFTQWFRRGQSK